MKPSKLIRRVYERATIHDSRDLVSHAGITLSFHRPLTVHSTQTTPWSSPKRPQQHLSLTDKPRLAEQTPVQHVQRFTEHEARITFRGTTITARNRRRTPFPPRDQRRPSRARFLSADAPNRPEPLQLNSHECLHYDIYIYIIIYI